MRNLGLTLALCAVASVGWAADRIDGADRTDFVQARDAWLDGDDMLALKSLKLLAGDGNVAAQMLLARIAEEPHMHRHVTGDMPRAERIDLLRQPGGFSGTSWMNQAATNSALASAMILAKAEFTSLTRDDGSQYSPEAEAAVQVLLEAGETELATEVVFKLFDGFFLRHTLDLIDRYENGFDPMIAPIRLATEQSLAAIDVLGDGAADAALFDLFAEQRDGLAPEIRLAGTHLDQTAVSGDPETQAFIMQHAEKVQAWTPLRELCEVSCAPSYSECLLAGVASMSAGRKFPFASPMQTLISNKDYWDSARIRGDTARKLAEVRQRFEIGASLNQCYADTVKALAN